MKTVSITTLASFGLVGLLLTAAPQVQAAPMSSVYSSVTSFDSGKSFVQKVADEKKKKKKKKGKKKKK